MRRHKRHHGKEQTRNETAFVVQYRYPAPGGWRTADFLTSDKAQAYRSARIYAERGWLRSFARHLGSGNWLDLTAKFTGEGEAQ